MSRSIPVTERKKGARSVKKTVQRAPRAHVVREQMTYDSLEYTLPDDFDDLMDKCKWLEEYEDDPAFTSLVEEILISMEMDSKATITMLNLKKVSAESLYWQLPSMSVHQEKYNENIAAEFSIVKGTKTTTQCPECKGYEWYIDIKQTRSGDEAPTVFPTCSTCYPRM